MARDMDMRLPLRDDPHAQVGQLVHDPPDRDLVAGNDPRREDHRVALGELELVIAGGDPPERRARLALPPGGDDQHFVLAAVASLRRIRPAAGNRADSRSPGRRAGCARASGRRCTPARPVSLATRPIVCSRAAFDAKVVTSTRPFAIIVLREQPLVDALFRARRPVLEDVGRIAHQREHAGIADRGQRLGARRFAQHRRLVDLPVAGVEDIAEGRLDQQPIAFGDRVRQRDEADLERPELDASAALDDVELDLAGQPFLLELAGDQAGGERRRKQRALQLLGEIGQRADMVLVAVGQDDPGQPLLLVLDELESGRMRSMPG